MYYFHLYVFFRRTWVENSIFETPYSAESSDLVASPSSWLISVKNTRPPLLRACLKKYWRTKVEPNQVTYSQRALPIPRPPPVMRKFLFMLEIYFVLLAVCRESKSVSDYIIMPIECQSQSWPRRGNWTCVQHDFSIYDGLTDKHTHNKYTPAF